MRVLSFLSNVYDDSKNNHPSDIINHCNRWFHWLNTKQSIQRNEFFDFYFRIKFFKLPSPLWNKTLDYVDMFVYGPWGSQKPKSSSVYNKLSNTILIIIYYHTMNDILKSRIDILLAYLLQFILIQFLTYESRWSYIWHGNKVYALLIYF